MRIYWFLEIRMSSGYGFSICFSPRRSRPLRPVIFHIFRPLPPVMGESDPPEMQRAAHVGGVKSS